MVKLLLYSFKWQYIARAGAGAGAEIKDKGQVEPESELKINNFGSATLLKTVISRLKLTSCNLDYNRSISN